MISQSLCLVLSTAFLANGQLYSFDTTGYGTPTYGRAAAVPPSPLQLLNPLRAVSNFKAIVGSLVPPICAPLLGPLAPQFQQPAIRAPLLPTYASRRSIQPPINPLIPQPSLATTLRNLQAAYSAAPPLACSNCNPLLPVSKVTPLNRLTPCTCGCNTAPCTCGYSQPACTCGNCNQIAPCSCGQPACACGNRNSLAPCTCANRNPLAPCTCGNRNPLAPCTCAQTSSCSCGACPCSSNPYAAYGYAACQPSSTTKEIVYERFV